MRRLFWFVIISVLVMLACLWTASIGQEQSIFDLDARTVRL